MESVLFGVIGFVVVAALIFAIVIILTSRPNPQESENDSAMEAESSVIEIGDEEIGVEEIELTVTKDGPLFGDVSECAGCVDCTNDE